ncbi:hypothetical protein ACGH7X_29065 [Streptomyces sp. BBFR51]|uniref:hypothetical protein n=1 Tax=Streptomyces sp. BBFR51 TaxID=3372856 RepID=UPI0037DC86B9
MGFRPGGLLHIPHSDEERRREQALRAFGGAVPGCFAVQQTWTPGSGRLPKALRAQQRDLFLRAQHGDTAGVLELLDAGMDPCAASSCPACAVRCPGWPSSSTPRGRWATPNSRPPWARSRGVLREVGVRGNRVTVLVCDATCTPCPG